MPITKWLCPACGGREVPLDHFTTTDCGNVIHPDYALAVRMQEDGQTDRTGVRVTHGLGCPRRSVIQATEPFAVDPTESNAALTGTAWHALMEKSGPPEHCEVEVKGEINGIAVSGKMDRVRGDVIEDWKHIGDFQLKYRREDGVKPEHVAQASIYAELLYQSRLQQATRCRIWYHTSKGGKDAMVPITADLMPIGQALQVKPYGGEYTVHELYEQADMALNRGADWRKLPLAGQSMSFGPKTMCDYCSVRSICTEAETGSPF